MTIEHVVILGANGTMGSGAGALFALAGIRTTIVARSLERAEAGRTRALKLAKGKLTEASIRCATYADVDTIASADLILEAVAETYPTKHAILEQLDQIRRPDTIIATVSSGLSINTLCADRSDSFRAHFLGVHLFNPPTAITGCELIPHANTAPGVVAVVRDFLIRLGREVVECRDTPAFAGNRLGFKLLNEVAQLAEEHGVAFMDTLLGPHTGRALPPLATIDLVGWDVHAAIVDNLYAHTHDVAHESFELPAYMRRGIAAGRLGRKSKAGFFKLDGDRQLVLSPVLDDYYPVDEIALVVPDCVIRMREAERRGELAGAIDVLCSDPSREAELLRKILLGYISYGLGLVGEVVERPRDIDRIMSFGFSWAPPGMLVDAIGPGRTIVLLEKARLPVPDAILQAAVHQRPLFLEPIDGKRFFPVAA